jgi:hypothetical protein
MLHKRTESHVTGSFRKFKFLQEAGIFPGEWVTASRAGGLAGPEVWY